MSSHDTPGVDLHQASAAHTHLIAQISDRLLQACGLGPAQSPDQLSQLQQDGSTPRGRGRPKPGGRDTLVVQFEARGHCRACTHLRTGVGGSGLQPIGPVAPVWLTRNGLVKRLLQAGLVPLQEVWEVVNARLALIGSRAVPATLAAFAAEILGLDETRLDAVGRQLKPLRGLSAHDPACFAGKLVGLFDLRAEAAGCGWNGAKRGRENCRVDMLDFLQGLSLGSLLLFDLGYFSFGFFATLTQCKLWWVSRQRENTSERIAHVFYRQREGLDALVWLGTGHKQARHLVRFVRLSDGRGVRRYLTTVCDPQLLSLGEVAQLYARRWDSEMAVRVLKEYLGMSHWWRSQRELLLLQSWVVLILAHLVYALRERIAQAWDCDLIEVSVPLVVELLPRLGSSSSLQVEQLVLSGRKSGLLRASPRLLLKVPQVELSCYHLAPPDLPRQRAGRAPSAPRGRAPKPTKRVCGYEVQRQRRQASKQAKASRAAQAKTAQLPTGVT